ncbi:hypothetical protein GGS23DRAFT_13296 [Durotheca rogersii]|uniref:uncharacterized protein n=1 Tax=Durotheca rogersii TaxID=419775 RepID=UPI00221E5F6F|nr:uncharacterized protein GGS23DRAFT_13296 [Durotheca rogersii]KAI5868133.1 hypothetical protein GGS23DRAFT_13296 [Durotheca rogersii]
MQDGMSQAGLPTATYLHTYTHTHIHTYTHTHIHTYTHTHIHTYTHTHIHTYTHTHTHIHTYLCTYVVVELHIAASRLSDGLGSGAWDRAPVGLRSKESDLLLSPLNRFSSTVQHGTDSTI